MNPKTLYLPKRTDNGYLSGSSGIGITWTKRREKLYIGGWFDGCVGIEGTEMTLKEFFDSLGITEKEVKKAFKEKREPKDQKE